MRREGPRILFHSFERCRVVYVRESRCVASYGRVLNTDPNMLVRNYETQSI